MLILYKVTYTRYIIPMPNAISPDKRPVSYLENRTVMEWMEQIAKDRKVDLAVVLREATSSYYIQHKDPSSSPSLFAQRSAVKAARRTATAKRIAAGDLSPKEAQEENAPIHKPVRIVDLWASVRRYSRHANKAKLA